ncbi:MAG: hypothetical protein K2X98_00350 [Alphaproteobacteria bacterium]|nr:hypothetical protein [Alphaproteobacteria bacterium]
MLSTNFAYFISFLIFVFFAYTYGHKKMKRIMDEKIQGIADYLNKGNEEKEKAQLALSAVKGELHRFESTLKEKTDEVEKHIASFQATHRAHLSNLLVEREKHHQTLLNAERAKNVELLKAELTQAVIKELHYAITNDPDLQKTFSEKSFGLIEEEFVRKF